MDNLNTHQSESLVLLIAKRLNIIEDLGIKSESGILKTWKHERNFYHMSHIKYVLCTLQNMHLGSIKLKFGLVRYYHQSGKDNDLEQNGNQLNAA